MEYSSIIHPKCKREINKACKRNPLLKKILKKKMESIIANPCHYKPLKYDLAGERRVHILKSFILKFEVDENKKIVKFLIFKHHDDVYRR